MPRRAPTVAVALMILATGITRAADSRPVEPLPKAEELHKLYTEKQYPVLLQKLARVLRLRGDAARPQQGARGTGSRPSEVSAASLTLLMTSIGLVRRGEFAARLERKAPKVMGE